MAANSGATQRVFSEGERANLVQALVDIAALQAGTQVPGKSRIYQWQNGILFRCTTATTYQNVNPQTLTTGPHWIDGGAEVPRLWIPEEMRFTVTMFQIVVETAIHATLTSPFRLRKNGVDAGLNLTIAAAATSGFATLTDAAGVVYEDSDTISIQRTAIGSNGTAKAGWVLLGGLLSRP